MEMFQYYYMLPSLYYSFIYVLDHSTVQHPVKQQHKSTQNMILMSFFLSCFEYAHNEGPIKNRSEENNKKRQVYSVSESVASFSNGSDNVIYTVLLHVYIKPFNQFFSYRS